MISNLIVNKLLLDVVSVPDVSGAIPFIVFILIGIGLALVVGAALLLYFLVFRNRKKK